MPLVWLRQLGAAVAGAARGLGSWVSARVRAAATWLGGQLSRLWVFLRAWLDVVTPLVLGVLLIGLSLVIYNPVVAPPEPPGVQGSGMVFVDSGSAEDVAVRLVVRIDPEADHALGTWPVTSYLEFVISAPAPTPRAVQWALLLYGDARMPEGVGLIPPNTRLLNSTAANPPYRFGEKEDVQIITGMAYLTAGANRVFTTQFTGALPREIVAVGGPKQAISLPRYGRVELDPLLQFAGEATNFDLGLEGQWSRPGTFEVRVEAGANGTDQRIDVASPDLEDQLQLVWTDEDSIAPAVLRTSLAGEAGAQRVTFILGAIVGAGAAAVLAALERVITRRRDDPEPAAGGGPAPPPAPAPAP